MWNGLCGIGLIFIVCSFFVVFLGGLFFLQDWNQTYTSAIVKLLCHDVKLSNLEKKNVANKKKNKK